MTNILPKLIVSVLDLLHAISLTYEYRINLNLALNLGVNLNLISVDATQLVNEVFLIKAVLNITLSSQNEAPER